jgi:uncharacterized protein
MTPWRAPGRILYCRTVPDDNAEARSLAHRPIEPTTVDNRITALDVLRGFALLGILLVNVMGFSGVVAGQQPTASPADGVVDWLVRHGARGVFFSSFSILFGIGFAMQMARIDDGSGARLSVYGRRLTVLLMFGLLHRLLDPAEVLVNYAVCGGLLLLFRRWSSTAVLLTAVLLVPLPFFHTAIVSSRPTPEAVTDAETSADPSSWDPYRGAESIAVHSDGSFADVVGYNVGFTTGQLSSSWVSYLWLTVPLPLMLFGMVIGRRKILSTLGTHASLIRKACWIGFGGSLVGRYAGSRLLAAAASEGWNPWIAFPGEVSWVLGGYALAVGYGAGILLLLGTAPGRRVLLPLRAVGRLALTNYLLQTVICTTLFYQYGMGLYGQVASAVAILIALGIFLTQLLFSAGWLRRYRFGPVEWVWRGATYWRVLSNAKAPTGP